MKIVVLSGSPKGKKSITLKYVEYLMKKFPAVEFSVHHVSQKIKKIEKDEATFQTIIDDVRSADGIIWVFPVYVYLVPSAYKRFVELISERGFSEAFAGKYAAVISTSIHFFDNVAHNYLHAVIDDLNMHYVNYYSAAMDDLLDENHRAQLESFMSVFLSAIEKQIPTVKAFLPVRTLNFTYEPSAQKHSVDLKGKKLLLITDAAQGSNLQRMQDRFLGLLKGGEVEVLCLHDIKMLGGCLGCCKCAFDNICAYGDKDDIKEIYEQKIPRTDIIIYAATIVDRFFSATWKCFFERRFMKTHQPLLTGKQIGALVSGPLNDVGNLRMFLEAEAQVGEANLAGIVCDEVADSMRLDDLIDQFAENLVALSDRQYVANRTYIGVGGTKIFRDEIWGKLRFVFQADHRYFKSHGVYDFPQKDYKARIRNFFMMRLLSIGKIREKTRNDLVNIMVEPYQKLIDEMK